SRPALGHQRERRPVVVGKHVDGEPRQRDQAVDADGDGGDKHKKPVGKAAADDGVEHLLSLCRASYRKAASHPRLRGDMLFRKHRLPHRTWLISSAASTTTRSPLATPKVKITRSPSSGAVRTGRGAKRSGPTLSQTWGKPFGARTTAASGTTM